MGTAHVAQDGEGSGLIPPINQPIGQIDERLAIGSGTYPKLYRDGLGAPKRGIAIPEIGKLEGSLDDALRKPQTRQETLESIAKRVVDAMESGLNRPADQALNPAGHSVGAPTGSSPKNPVFTPQLDVGSSAP